MIKYYYYYYYYYRYHNDHMKLFFVLQLNRKFVIIKYLLLTEFEVRTVSYGPSFFPLIYSPSAKRAGHKSTGKNEDP